MRRRPVHRRHQRDQSSGTACGVACLYTWLRHVRRSGSRAEERYRTMVHPATQTPDVLIAETGPTGFIQQAIPYVYAFALGTAPVLESRMPLGRIVSIAVADGTRAPHGPDDLFARRVPGIPAVTGPVLVTGVRRGD